MVIQEKYKNVWIVMPAFNAALTLEQTFNEIPPVIRRNILLVDDCSTDDTVLVAKKLGILVVEHSKNSGYGANQKTCYKVALSKGAEVILMLHPDNQYDPRVTTIMADLVMLGNSDIVLGSRIRNRRDALKGGMPLWKYLLNRLTTLFENIALGQNLGDFHSGFRAYSRKVLETVPYFENSDDFGFDQEFLMQCVYFNFRIGDIPVPSRYFENSSSINFTRSLNYGRVALLALIQFYMNRLGVKIGKLFKSKNDN
jgi:glycosyltransferase involved in cell wall biosynthesis